MRRVAETHTLSSGVELQKDEMLAALIAVANFDRKAFPEPFRFSLDPYLDGPERKLENYLLFGSQVGDKTRDRSCFGREFALFVIVECIKAAARLQGLQRVAGKAGEAARPLYIMTGLPGGSGAYWQIGRRLQLLGHKAMMQAQTPLLLEIISDGWCRRVLPGG